MEKLLGSEANGSQSLVISYLTLRKAIGVLGISFPFTLSFGAFFLFGSGIQSSISSYYYTGMRNVFVGILCSIAIFLFSYQGYERSDQIAGKLGCLFGVGVALFPTTPDSLPPDGSRLIGYIHWGFAALFFSVLIYFSLFLFTKTNTTSPTMQKIIRNRVYRVCGYAMLACIILMGLWSFFPNGASILNVPYSIFWLESITVIAFGISWLTKGEAILKDENLVLPLETGA